MCVDALPSQRVQQLLHLILRERQIGISSTPEGNGPRTTVQVKGLPGMIPPQQFTFTIH
jgi:hypothetical protein